MFKSLGKMMGGSSKKGKSKVVSGADDDASLADDSSAVDSLGRTSKSTGQQGLSSTAGSSENGWSSRRKGGGASSSSIPVDGAQKIEKKGGLSRHESPLPSPSGSSRNPLSESLDANGGGNALENDSLASSPYPTNRNDSNGGSGGAHEASASARQAASAAASSAPGIPTTHTILANPPGSAQAGSRSMQPSASQTSGADGVRTFDIDDMISRLLEAGYAGKIPKPALKNAEITAVCQAAREVFLSQPTLIELSPPVKIVGDTHGQYQDLLRLFEMCGFPPSANYLFLGDYVDRGKQSLETILLLLCYKIKYPENFFLLRGNHECANVTRVYGFYDECKRRVNIKIWKTFIDVFNTLPIAAVVASKIFCVHGGLSPSLSNMDDIRRIERPTDVPDYGLLNDLLWSDPSDTALDWEDNERGVSYCFGKAVIQQFLAQYDFDLICRAHMVVEDGYEFWNERTLVTIFSAPNYCGEFDNFGAVMSVSEDLLCAFELLKPLDGAALKREMAKNKRRSLMQHQSPPARPGQGSY
ncbi:unnamed protein product [Sympodiomycopsis kandeliae]